MSDVLERNSILSHGPLAVKHLYFPTELFLIETFEFISNRRKSHIFEIVKLRFWGGFVWDFDSAGGIRFHEKRSGLFVSVLHHDFQVEFGCLSAVLNFTGVRNEKSDLEEGDVLCIESLFLQTDMDSRGSVSTFIFIDFENLEESSEESSRNRFDGGPVRLFKE